MGYSGGRHSPTCNIVTRRSFNSAISRFLQMAVCPLPRPLPIEIMLPAWMPGGSAPGGRTSTDSGESASMLLNGGLTARIGHDTRNGSL